MAQAGAVLSRAFLSLANSAWRRSGTLLSLNSQQMLAAHQSGIALGHELTVLCAPHLVHGVTEVLGDVEAVEHDLPLRVGQHFPRGLDEWFPHIHRDRLDAAQRARAQRVETDPQALFAPVLGDFEDAASLEVDQQRAVLVSLRDRLLIDTEQARRSEFAARKTAGHGTLLDVWASSQLSPSSRAAFFTSMFSITSIASRSNSIVKRDFASAQGTRA